MGKSAAQGQTAKAAYRPRKVRFEVTSVPRYLLLDRTGAIRHDEARRAGEPRLGAVLEKLLAQ